VTAAPQTAATQDAAQPDAATQDAAQPDAASTPPPATRKQTRGTRHRKPPSEDARLAKLASHRCAAADGPHAGAHDPNLSQNFPGHAERMARLAARARRKQPLYNQRRDDGKDFDR